MRLLVTGASGQLGGYLLRELSGQAIDVTAWSHSQSGELFGRRLRQVDLSQAPQVASAFREARPDAILHLAAQTTVTACHDDPEHAERINVRGAAQLAELAAAAKARLVLASTDLVFDGTKGDYRESDPPNPLSVYGHTKLRAEKLVLAAPGGVVARLSLLFGSTVTGRPYFFDDQCSKLRAGQPVTLFPDEWRTPFGMAAAARALLALVQADFSGLIHIGGPERMSRYEMGQRLAAYLGCAAANLVAASRTSVPALEPRPRDTSFNVALWRSLFPDQWWPAFEETLQSH